MGYPQKLRWSCRPAVGSSEGATERSDTMNSMFNESIGVGVLGHKRPLACLPEFSIGRLEGFQMS